MSATLVIDTSTNRTTVGIVAKGAVVFEKHHDDPIAHGEVLPKLVKEALAQFPDISEVVVGMGPGPFTGLRVGIAFAQSFALARGIACRGVSSLDAIASQISDSEFIVTIDARRKEVFWARYQDGKRTTDHLVASPLSLSKESPIYNDLTPTVAGLVAVSESFVEPIYVRRPDAFPAPQGVKFRTMTVLDAVDVHAIEKLSYLHDPWSLAQFKEELGHNDRYYIAATRDEKVIGYAGILRRGDTSDVMTLTVAPDERRKGIARELLRRLIDWGRVQKSDAIMLEVRAGNDEATPLYQSFGFVEVSRRKDYYGPGLTAIVMRKDLRK
jgi:tRNA threonylcarbamoyl adenosine modification protein YeaZ/ribosomal-protein-alanine acetyltransferase